MPEIAENIRERQAKKIIKIEMREIVIHAHPNSDMVIDFLPIENVENQRVSLKYHITYNVIPENTAPETEYIRFTSNFAKLISTGNVSTNFNS